jgi:hypothetical protein
MRDLRIEHPGPRSNRQQPLVICAGCQSHVSRAFLSERLAARLVGTNTRHRGQVASPRVQGDDSRELVAVRRPTPESAPAPESGAVEQAAFDDVDRAVANAARLARLDQLSVAFDSGQAVELRTERASVSHAAKATPISGAPPVASRTARAQLPRAIHQQLRPYVGDGAELLTEMWRASTDRSSRVASQSERPNTNRSHCWLRSRTPCPRYGEPSRGGWPTVHASCATTEIGVRSDRRPRTRSAALENECGNPTHEIDRSARSHSRF